MNEDHAQQDGAPESPRDSAATSTIPQLGYELLREIGGGAYGVVWLARDPQGAYRAVKIVSREKFEHDRPYEREYEGIRKFEPISRSYDNQVRILQVGREDDRGRFFYVMELADDQDTGQQINPATYTPKTLKSELQKRGHFPLKDCLRIGAALAAALQNLHQHGLIHRDIKPSNVIFVNDVPKLADIGLVTGLDLSVSYVGTEGFIPPEGPGSAQSDIYGLGKVLYEMATGRDRMDFPELPTDLEKRPDREAFLELNAVIAKACAHNLRERYQSARPMLKDLACLQRGQSVRSKRLWWRRLVVAGATSVLAAVIGLVVYLLLKGPPPPPGPDTQRWTNALGMIFVQVPGTKVLFSIWETRVKDFQAFVDSTGHNATGGMISARRDGWKSRGDTWMRPGFAQGPTHPVCGVNWTDAEAFCRWLTTREREAGRLDPGQYYRLPTEAEWSRAGGNSIYPWGSEWPPPAGVGNYAGSLDRDPDWPTERVTLAGYRDGFPRTAPVGSFGTNQFGLFDLGGNLWEWLSDAELKNGREYRMLRGGSWRDGAFDHLKSSFRLGAPNIRSDEFGFRVVLELPVPSR